jgi:hypothetical protein
MGSWSRNAPSVRASSMAVVGGYVGGEVQNDSKV